MHIVLSISGIYLFIIIGFMAKKVFKEKIDEKSFVLFSIYFLHPILIFWGLTIRKIDLSVIDAPFIFLVVMFISLSITYIASRYIFNSQKDKSIATVASIIGNTGNLGIPLAIALFGEESVIYTSIINLVNIFFVNIIGVYFYARGNFEIKESLLKIFKLPAIWFGLFSLWFNYMGFGIPKELALPVEMGAYATMVVQLAIFGMYLATVRYREVEWRLFGFVSVIKFIIVPIIAILVLKYFELSNLVYNVILLELLVPIAVMNVNLASLYECKPKDVAFLIFTSSFIFLFYLFGAVDFLFR